MNNREIAVVVWTGLVVVAVAIHATRDRSFRELLLGLVKTLFTPPILIPATAYIVWVGFAARVTLSLPLWHPDLTFEFVWWCVTVGLVALFSISSARSDEGLVSGLVLGALVAAVSVDSIVNLAVFPLAIEMILLPLATTLLLVGLVAKREPETESVSALTNGCMTVIGFLLMGTIFVFAITGRVDWGLELRAVILPFWLTLWIIPLVWLLYIWLGYDEAFRWIGFELDGNASRRVKFAIAIRCHWDVDSLGGFRGVWVRQAGDARGLVSTIRVVSKYLDSAAESTAR